nr:hypothetical protein [uncultured Oscillibacter sp.]
MEYNKIRILTIGSISETSVATPAQWIAVEEYGMILHGKSILTTYSSSEIPTTVPFPPCGENCTLVGISSLSAATRSAGLAVDRGRGMRGDFPEKSILTAYSKAAEIR